MIRKVVGIIFILVGVVGLFLSFRGMQLGHQLVDNTVSQLDQLLLTATDTLTNTENTLLLTQAALADVQTMMGTVELTTDNVAQTISETKPLLEQSNMVVTQQVPDSLETLQETIPTLQEVAANIDSALRTLTRFRIDRNILGFELNYDLGINYDPDIPFDVAIMELGNSLDGVPESLRGLEIYLSVATGNMDTMSLDLHQLADDVNALNERLLEMDPLLMEYIRIVVELNDSMRLYRGQLAEKGEGWKTAITITFVWLALLQLPPLYLGYELVTGQRDPDRYVTRAEWEAERRNQMNTAVEPID
jgi:hypothetical protein